MMSFNELRQKTGKSLRWFSEYFNIPYRTIQNWDGEQRQCPEYLLALMEYKLKKENIIN